MKSIFLKTVNFLFPVSCSLCGKILPHDDIYRLCEDCLGKLKKIEGLYCVKCGKALPDGGQHCYTCSKTNNYHFENVRSYCQYEGAAKSLVHKIKYSNQDYLDKIMGKFMVEIFDALSYRDNIDYIACVPMHWIKQYIRGYNQAELLAIKVSERCGKPLLEGFKRKRITKPQYRLTKDERSKNIFGSFELAEDVAAIVNGKTILLIDDVCTTCATIEECSRTLKRAGAEKVYGLTFAKD